VIVKKVEVVFVGGRKDNGSFKHQGVSAFTVVVGEFKKKK
jgi:hypothetical protein